MSNRKKYTGTVISDKMQKTAVVQIMQQRKHPMYGRLIKKYAKFKAHDEKNTAKIGDTVRIQETRPLSKDKHFRILEIIKKSEGKSIEIKE